MRKRLCLLAAAGFIAAGLLAGCASAGDNQAAGAGRPVQTADETETEKETDVTAALDISSEAAVTEGKTLVVYYSATGNTEQVANVIADITGADLLELEPETPYTTADLNWTDDNSRVSREHDNPELREVELVSNTVSDWDSVSTVYIGYPIWWAIAAWPVDSFIKANDFTGKTVFPFCTSSSSGLGESGELLARMAGSGEWKEGVRFRSGVSEEDVLAWVEGLGV